MKSIGVAAHAYIAEHNNFLPYRADNSNWMYNVAPYLGVIPGKNSGNEPFTNVFLCPDDPSVSPRQLRTYRYNQSTPSTSGAKAYGRSNYTPNKFSEIISPGTHAMVVCVAYTGPRALQIWRFDESIWKKLPDANNDPVTSNFPRPHYQGKAMNALYSDGHVGKATYPIPSHFWNFDGRDD